MLNENDYPMTYKEFEKRVVELFLQDYEGESLEIMTGGCISGLLMSLTQTDGTERNQSQLIVGLVGMVEETHLKNLVMEVSVWTSSRNCLTG